MRFKKDYIFCKNYKCIIYISESQEIFLKNGTLDRRDYHLTSKHNLNDAHKMYDVAKIFVSY